VGSAVSKKYTPHQTDHVERLAEAGAYAIDPHGMVGEVSCYWKAGHHVFIKPTDDQRREICDGDGVFPVLMISAGYDAKPVSFQLGIYRDVCRNLAMMRQVDGMSLTARLRHSSGLEWKVDDLVQQISQLTDRTDTLMDAFQRANEREVQFAEFYREVYPLDPDATRRARAADEKRLSAMISRLWEERQMLGSSRTDIRTVSMWEAFQTTQWYVQHEKPRKNLGATPRVERVMRAVNDKTVERAAELAFAEV